MMSCACLNCGTPGFRFHPTDEELTDQLRNKILGVETPGRPIAVVDDLGKLEPREIPELTTNSWDSDQTCYFFWSPVYKKNGISRTAKNGFWKATGKVRKVKGKKKVIGQKKTLVFYESGSPPSLTPWVIHEYHLIESGLCDNKEKYVLCKLKLKDDGKAAISSPAEAQSMISLPLIFSGNNGEHQPAHSPASSVTCNVNREESLSIYMPSSFKNDCFSSGDKEEMNNATSDYQVSTVLDSTQKASLGHHHPELDSQDYESGSDLPDNDGSHMARVSLPDDHMDPAKLGSAEGCAESFINSSPLQILNHGEAMVTWEQAPIADSFSFDNGVYNQSSTDGIDEQEWKSLLADPIEDCIGEENDQQHVVSGIECLDTVSTSTKRSSRKRLREGGNGFSDGKTETSRVKVGVEGQPNVTPTMEERKHYLRWALRSECRRQGLISYGDESFEDLFFSDDFFGSHTELQAAPVGRPQGRGCPTESGC